MAETARETITIAAPVQQVFDTLIDFESYPEWASDLKQAHVVRTDDEGRALEVEFRAAAMGRSTTYRLAYDYEGAPNRLGWTLVEGDLERELDGSYRLAPSPSDTLSTDIVYELSIDLIVPIPGFVKRRAESRIIKTALDELKSRVESTVVSD
jgi:uncharacterized membrane protein